jgi:large repetitive protein
LIPFQSSQNKHLTPNITTGQQGSSDQGNQNPPAIGKGVILSSRSGLLTSENLTSVSVTIKLTDEPTEDVVINLNSLNTNEVTVSPSTITFNPSDWNQNKLITFTGVDDSLIDGNQLVNIDLGFLLSNDISYSGISAGMIEVTNADNDAAGVTVSNVNGLVVSESGSSQVFSVVLNQAPTSSVTIPVSSSDLTEGILNLSNLTFTTADWNIPKQVIITGVNDFITDGNINFQINLGPVSSADLNYNNLSVASLNATNQDNDNPDYTITNVNLVTSENGTTGTFFVVLNSMPTDDVVIPITNNDLSEGNLSTTSLTFTPSSWNLTQAVVVTGVNDSLLDGNINYTIQLGSILSNDTNYSSLPPKTVSVTNNDNDTAGFDITSASGHTGEDGTTAFFRVRLLTIPTNDVTINFNSSNTNEGTIQSGSSLTFTASNWNAYQTVLIKGVNDSFQDGDISYSLISNPATSLDPNYNSLNPSDISIINDDNDTAGYVVAYSGIEPLFTNENGSQIRFTIKLRTRPTNNVIFSSISSSDTLAGVVSPNNLTFTNSNWSVPQVVTVTGVNNNFVNSSGLPYAVNIQSPSSTDPTYLGLLARTINFINSDNDTRGYTFSKTRNFITSELGNQDSFTLRLNSQPIGGSVVIPISSSDTNEVIVSPSSLIFTAANWNVPQTITMTGVADSSVDGTKTVNLILGTASASSSFRNYFPNTTSSDYDTAQISDYNGAVTHNGIFSLSNCDANQKISVCLPIASDRVTNESGASFQYYVLLSQAPTANVTIPVSVTDTVEASLSTSTITLTPANWNQVNLITVTGRNDTHLDILGTQIDGNKIYNVVHDLAISSDSFFSGFDPVDILNITNSDNDSPNLIITPSSSSGSRITLIDGQSMNLSIRLNAAPTSDVSFTVSGTGFTITPSPTLTFNSSNWNMIQVVTVSHLGTLGGKTLFTSNFTSLDPIFNGRTTNDAFFNIVQAGFTVSAISGDTDETGTTRTFTVRLNAPPTSNVTINLNSLNTNEVIITSATSLVFTPANWSTNQTVTVQGVDDGVIDFDQTTRIELLPAVSSDSSYNGLDPSDVTVINIDND